MPESRGNRARKTNGWMWAFLILVAILTAAGIWLYMVLQPADQNQEAQPGEEVVMTEDSLTFEVLTNKAQLNRVINLYLESEMDDQFDGYTFTIDEDVELAGILQIFGFDVDFTLLMDPYVMEDGNLQLRATSIQLGSLELPIGIAMNVLSQQLDLPNWVRIDSEQQFIISAVNHFPLVNAVQRNPYKLHNPC